MNFPNKINYSLPSGYPGDIASANPRRTAIAPEGGFRCGDAGLLIGRFGWVQEDGISVSNTVPSANKKAIPAGFVLRDMTAILQSLSEDGTLRIPAGFPAPVMTGGDYWAVSTADTKAGDAVFANPSDGSLAASGTVTGFVVSRGGAAGDIIMISAACGPMPASAAASQA